MSDQSEAIAGVVDGRAEAKAELLPLLPQTLFPEGDKAGWWLKAVQLDLEAKGVIQRENTKPLRLLLSK